jgi:NAD(P)-dependent dehydrogenase (short-subunit alcohol dehydrogenase family)
VITGAGGTGIGRACSQRLFEEGAHVVSLERPKDAERGEEVVASITSQGGTSQTSVVDLHEHLAVKEALGAVIAEHGRIDALLNVMPWGWTRPPDDWRYTLASAFAPPYFGTFYGAEYMSRHGGGSIVNWSSAAGVVITGRAAVLPPLTDEEAAQDFELPLGSYGAAKATVHHLSKEFAVKYAARGVRVNTIAPGYMATPFTLERVHGEYRDQVEATIPMGKLGAPEDIAAAAAYFASDDAKYVTGQLIVVDGGYGLRAAR